MWLLLASLPPSVAPFPMLVKLWVLDRFSLAVPSCLLHTPDLQHTRLVWVQAQTSMVSSCCYCWITHTPNILRNVRTV